jgi:hypothetical protein
MRFAMATAIKMNFMKAKRMRRNGAAHPRIRAKARKTEKHAASVKMAISISRRIQWCARQGAAVWKAPPKN